MKKALKNTWNFFMTASASTLFYEVAISSPWWTGSRQDGYYMLFRLTVPSLMLLLLAYYLLQKKETRYVQILSGYLVLLQIAILFTVYGTMSGLL